MTDYKLPEPEDEFISGTKAHYSRMVAAHVKDFSDKLRRARTLQALESLKRDITRSDLSTNFQAKEELRALANTRAKEMGFKSHEEWWS
jgi:hypothetical protein